MSLQEKERNRIAQMYLKFLSGPLGKGVLQHLKEGESVTIRANDELLQISKSQGKAIVRILLEENSKNLRTQYE